MPVSYKLGDSAKYYSERHSTWVDCAITAVGPQGEVQVSCKEGAWLSLSEQAAKLQLATPVQPVGSILSSRSARTDSFATVPLPSVSRLESFSPRPMAVGDQVYYFSESHQSWCPCSVVAVLPSGDIQVNIKPGYWISVQEQAVKISLTGDLPNPPNTIGVKNDSGDGLGLTFGTLTPENLAWHNAASSATACRSKAATSMRAPSEFSMPASLLSGVTPPAFSPPQTYVAPPSMGNLGSPSKLGHFDMSGATQPNSMNSLNAEVASVHSTASLPVTKDYNRVSFDPGVSVSCFKASVPAAFVREKGKSYECNLESAVEVPRSFSFGSSSSVSSYASTQSAMGTMSAAGYPRFSSSLGVIAEGQVEGQMVQDQILANSNFQSHMPGSPAMHSQSFVSPAVQSQAFGSSIAYGSPPGSGYLAMQSYAPGSSAMMPSVMASTSTVPSAV